MTSQRLTEVIQIRITPTFKKRISDYQRKSGIGDFSECCRKLISVGLDQYPFFVKFAKGE